MVFQWIGCVFQLYMFILYILLFILISLSYNDAYQVTRNIKKLH